MSLRLILIRHAKSGWDDPMLDDHDRPLNDRGRRDAPRIGAWLSRQRLCPEVAYVSTATRAQETWSGIAGALPGAPPATGVAPLYLAAPGTILAVAQGADRPTIAIVGHNPGIAEAAHGLAMAAPGHTRFADCPTGAVCVLTFEKQTWGEVGWRDGKVVHFVTPHDL